MKKKYYCSKCERYHYRGKIYEEHQKFKTNHSNEEKKKQEKEKLKKEKKAEPPRESNKNSSYFCTKCHRMHYRGKIFENHLKYKEKEDLTIEESDSFIMKGKMGEEIKVKTKKLDDVLRINLYKYNNLACTLDISVEKDYFKRNSIRELIREQCF
ncbi:MAG: hypothetical protein EU550_02725 [Promethearchaeota archaeon]|nr:MAG: hypothetical protein EU550_02725 [Candidatus Lokiarchaeota archaeon]